MFHALYKIVPPRIPDSSRGGFTLVEILLALFILQLIIAPVYLMFTETQRTMFKAADTVTASSIAGSLIAGLRDLPPAALKPQPLTEDTALEKTLSLENLDVPPAPKDFTRRVELVPIDQNGREGGPFYLVEVQIDWFNRKTKTPAKYVIRDLLRGDQ